MRRKKEKIEKIEKIFEKVEGKKEYLPPLIYAISYKKATSTGGLPQ